MNNTDIPILKLADLHIGYPQALARKEGIIYGPLNTEIRGPEMIGIIGRNGIGKSTLLRTLTGIQPALQGKIFLFGTDSRKINRSGMARIISYVSTESVHIQNLRVEDLVTLGRFPYANWFGRLTREDIGIIGDAIEHTGIQNLRNKPVHKLSDGERQKVMIARALAQDTPVIVLDEPTAFLDLPARHEILRLLNNLCRKKNKLIVFSTHDLSIAMDEVDKLWLMTGEGLVEGAPEDLLINQGFRKLFVNSDIEYDDKSLAFRFSREMDRTVFVQGDQPYSAYTSKAMERIGFRTIDEGTAEYEISIDEKNNFPVWEFLYHGSSLKFDSLYALADYLKNLH